MNGVPTTSYTSTPEGWANAKPWFPSYPIATSSVAAGRGEEDLTYCSISNQHQEWRGGWREEQYHRGDHGYRGNHPGAAVVREDGAHAGYRESNLAEQQYWSPRGKGVDEHHDGHGHHHHRGYH